MECIMVVTSTAFSSLGNWSVIIASIVGSWGSWGKPLHWQTSSLWFCKEVFFGAGGGLGEKLEMANSIYCCCDCCTHCTHVSCKKVLFGPGGLGGKCIDKLNLLLLCVCVTSIAFKQPPTKPKCEDPIRAGMGQPFKQPPTKPKFEDPIREGMGQPLSVSLTNNVRCSPNPSCFF